MSHCTAYKATADSSLRWLEAAWEVVDRVLDNDTAPHIYRPGTWEPEQAAALMAHYGGWHDPAGSKAHP